MAHKNQQAFPPPPDVPQLLNDLLVWHPAEPGSMVPPPLRPDQYPAIASVPELEDLSRALRRCTESAQIRAGSARAALEYFGQRVGGPTEPAPKRETGASLGSRRDRDDDDFEIGGSRRRNGVERHGSFANDGPTTGRPKKAHTTAHGAADVGASRSTPGLPDTKRDFDKPGRGRKAVNGSASSRNSVSPVRVKREGSASPAPSVFAHDAGSMHGSLASTSQRKTARSPSAMSTDGPDIPLSQSGHKKKKRKIANGDDGASVDGRSARLGSPSASVRSTASTLIPASGIKDRPVGPQQSSSNLKLKLKVGGTEASTPEPVYHHPVINFQPPRQPTFALSPSAYRPASSVAPAETATPTTAARSELPPTDPPPVTSLIPIRQPVPRPPAPGPKRQKDVNQDFTQVKSVPQQTSWNTFWAGIEPYLREIGPEDLAMLRLEQDNVTPFVAPPLGRHYQDVWDEEDLNLPFGGSSANSVLGGLSASAAAAQAARESRMASRRGKFIAPRDMADDDLADDLRGLGGLTERVASALLPDEIAVEQKPEDSKQREAQAESKADVDMDNSQMNDSATAVVDLNSPVKDLARLHDAEDLGRSPVKQESSDSINDPKISEVEDGYEDLNDYQWPIAPHRIPSPSHKPGERDRADVVGVDINDLEEGVKREMRLLQLIGPEEQVRSVRIGVLRIC